MNATINQPSAQLLRPSVAVGLSVEEIPTPPHVASQMVVEAPFVGSYRSVAQVASTSPEVAEGEGEPGPVEAWIDGTIVRYRVYDAETRSWRADFYFDSFDATVAAISISDAAVHFVIGGAAHTAGDQSPTHSWYNGPTMPLAYFFASPTTGDAVDSQALARLMAEWTRLDADYLTRVDHVLHGTGLNTPYRLDTSTVLEDGLPDLVWGEGGRDVFLVSASDATPDWVAAGVDAEFNLARDVANLPPAVALSQAAGQFDPTSGLPIHFTVKYSEPVTGLAADDFTVTGDAPGTPAVTVTGSGTTYDVAISGLTNAGTVTVALRTGAAQDAAGTPSLDPLTIDDTVTYRPWTNQRKPADVAPEAEFSPYVTPNDPIVSALDVLYVINYINAHGTGPLPPPPPVGVPAFYDVNGNGFVAAIDVLLVINYINSHAAGAGEAEATGSSGAALMPSSGAWSTAEAEPSDNVEAALATPAIPRDFVWESGMPDDCLGDAVQANPSAPDFVCQAAVSDAVFATWGESPAVRRPVHTPSRIAAVSRFRILRGQQADAATPRSFADAVDGLLAGWDGA